ncbi:MAG: hypothetical protein JWN04_3647 [Myxococcaceae bacterium]|nr:hypothetical protein [Myxococcaceae bacterium]
MRARARWASATLLSVGFLLLHGHALSARAESPKHWADECVETLSSEEVDQTLSFVGESLQKQRGGAIAWWTGWTGFNIFNLALGGWKYATAPKQLARDSWLVSEIGAAAFVLQVAALPMPGMYAHHRLAKLPEDTPEQRRSKLLKGLGLLDKAAMVERTNSNWVAHVAGLAYATASSAYVWIRNRHADHHRLELAVSLQFVTSVAFAELTFLTVPRRARRDLESVRAGACTHHEGSATLHRLSSNEPPRASFGLAFYPGQLALTGRF